MITVRTVGVAIAGVLAGLLAGFLLFDELLSRLLVASGDEPGTGLGLLIGFGPIVLAIAGAVTAVRLDGRKRALGGRS
jgi:hypothetical protein